MAKDHVKNIRFTKEELDYLEKKADEEGTNVSAYIRKLVYNDQSKNTISKKDFLPHMLKIASKLDNAKLSESRLAYDLKKEFKKIWEFM